MRIAIQRNVYEGYLDKEGGHLVDKNNVPFDVGPSLEVRMHSPTGFAWGFEGSGPAQLSLAILLEELVPLGFSVIGVCAYYQDYKREVIARLAPDKAWRLTSADVVKWFMAKIQNGLSDCQGGQA
jgi:Family of unknown function (DUF6166)